MIDTFGFGWLGKVASWFVGLFGRKDGCDECEDRAWPHICCHKPQRIKERGD